MQHDAPYTEAPAAIELLLVRHGETQWNADARLQGQTDIPLNEVGRRQALEIAGRLAKERIGAVVTSDLRRALETAKPLAERIGVPLVVERSLRERDFGVLEGLTRAELVSRHSELFAALWARLDCRPPGGESMDDLLCRVGGCVDRIVAEPPARVVVMVTHGGVIRATLAHLLRRTERLMDRTPIPNAGVVRLLVGGDGVRLHEA